MITGITGHRRITNITWVGDTLAKQITRQGITHGLSSLAAGAGQLFADLLLQRHIPYTAVVPSEHYEDTFEEPNDVKTYQNLLVHAQNVHRLHFGHPSDPADWAAAQYIADHCALLIAVWDGRPSPSVSGASKVVAYAKQHKKRIMHLNPDTKEIIEL